MSYLNAFLKNILDFFYNMTGNYGVAIILLSLAVMVATFPLNLKQMQFTKSMQLLKPETEEIKKKFKGDKEKINQATMALWTKYGVNPASGCLPMLIQLPVLFGMFAVLQTDQLFASNPIFLGLNLTLPGRGGSAIALGVAYWILPLLSVVTTYWQQVLTTPGDDQTAKTMLYTMPLFMGWITIRFATAIALYWVSRNVFSIVQQYIFNKLITPQLKVVGEDTTIEKRGKDRKDS
ncbi:MAG: YidC/Oxa1 family membrane protein insertase [bacterium]|nr:YidC/Oxa1 family membrane protein insertase [bacterium]